MSFTILSNTFNMQTGNVLHPFLDILSVLYAAVIYPRLTFGHNNTGWISYCAVNSTLLTYGQLLDCALIYIGYKDTSVMPKQKYFEYF